MELVLNKIKLVNFKNYEQAELACAPGINCLVGKNGMGKTNFLDAIYYLCMTKSHFNTTDPHIIRHEQDFFRLEGHFQRDNKSEEIVAKYQLRKKKGIEKNKVPYTKLSEHIGQLPVVMLTPDDTLIATEGSEGRRKFIDNTLSQIDQEYLHQLMLYNKLLKQRNALLKKMGEEGRFQAQLLDVYNTQMVEPANFIHERRKNFSEVLLPVFKVMHEYLCQKEEEVQLNYLSPLAETSMLDLLKKNQEKDRILQRTTQGIHRDELQFTIEGRPLKKFASQGQLKSYILALKLSQYEILRQYVEIAPILLLDDVFDKLDHFRVGQLLELLVQENVGQVFISDTNPNRVARVIQRLGMEQRQFLVDRGKITEIPVN